MRRLALAALVLLLVTGCRGGAASGLAKNAGNVAKSTVQEAGATRSVRLPPAYGDVLLPPGSQDQLVLSIDEQINSFLASRSWMTDEQLSALAKRGCEVKNRVELGLARNLSDATEAVISDLGGTGATRLEIMEIAADLQQEQSAGNVGKLAVFAICQAVE